MFRPSKCAVVGVSVLRSTDPAEHSSGRELIPHSLLGQDASRGPVSTREAVWLSLRPHKWFPRGIADTSMVSLVGPAESWSAVSDLLP